MATTRVQKVVWSLKEMGQTQTARCSSTLRMRRRKAKWTNSMPHVTLMSKVTIPWRMKRRIKRWSQTQSLNNPQMKRCRPHKQWTSTTNLVKAYSLNHSSQVLVKYCPPEFLSKSTLIAQLHKQPHNSSKCKTSNWGIRLTHKYNFVSQNSGTRQSLKFWMVQQKTLTNQT